MKESNLNQSNKFILLFVAIIIFIFFIFGFRFFELSIQKTSHGEDLTSYLKESDNPRSSIMEAKRGTIYDIHGQPIAIDTTSYSLYAILQEGNGFEAIQDPDQTASVLSNYIDLSRDAILDILLNDQAIQVEFGIAGKNLSQETKDAIEAESISGINFVSQSSRNYINDYFSSHLIGFANNQNDISALMPRAEILTGQIGIEAAYNNYLSGQSILEENPDMVERTHTLLGEDIYLTLDARLQNYLEDLLTYAYDKYKPEEISAYLVEVESGKLLSAGQRPSFNLNTLEGIDLQWTNQLVEEAYEPGSTMKILTQAVAHDMGVYLPDELIQTGSITIEDVIVKDYNLTGWGEISFDHGLARSSNVTIVELINRIGLETWKTKLRNFGFGESTDSGLANETTGTTKFDDPVSATMSGFGQGFAATPMQMLQAFTAIANGGKMMKVQYLNGIGENNQFLPIQLGQPISKESADHIVDIMVDTVNESYGTAQEFANSKVQLAAKTGTAQIAQPDGQGYLTGPNDYYFSVVGFFPAEHPKYLLYYTMKRPTDNKGRMGSAILAEIFKPFVDYIMVYD